MRAKVTRRDVEKVSPESGHLIFLTTIAKADPSI
jgi:hypothetical protein